MHLNSVTRFAFFFTVTIGGASTALAVDGVVLIDQARALAGNVTPGDTPGFPVTLSRAGSYRLSGNLTVPDENTTAVVVDADDVSVDLNGFAILGPTVCENYACAPIGIGRGVSANGPGTTTVMNGTVRGVGDRGLRLDSHARVEKVRAISNGSVGISVENGVIEGSQALKNRRDGFLASGRGTVVRGNTSEENGGDGFSLGPASNVSGNIAHSNLGDGILVQEASIVTGNTSALNGFGLRLQGLSSAYSHNVFNLNSVAVSINGVSLGQNLCDGVIC